MLMHLTMKGGLQRTASYWTPTRNAYVAESRTWSRCAEFADSEWLLESTLKDLPGVSYSCATCDLCHFTWAGSDGLVMDTTTVTVRLSGPRAWGKCMPLPGGVFYVTIIEHWFSTGIIYIYDGATVDL
jgi:hypothetical protein